VDNAGVDLSTPYKLQRTERPTPCITTTSIRQKRRAVIVEHSLLKGTKGPICSADPPYREVCCLPGARVRDTTLPSPVQPSDYYPLLLFQVGGNEIAVHKPRMIKRDFRALGWLVRESRAQVIFFSLVPVAGSDVPRNRWTQSIHTWLHG